MGSSTVTAPSDRRARLVRTGFVKAEPGELDWLRTELLTADKHVRQQWFGAQTAATLVGIALLAMVASLAGSRFTFYPLLGTWTVLGGLFSAWAPTDLFRSRRTATLKRHGLLADGTPDLHPSRSARMIPSRWLAMQLLVLAGLALVAAFLLG